ncbi:prostaglandin reductase 1-like isoform X2 [Octopus sinensis]|nr:prostaglandin reductase 1-like isoform X2 [Octopus sinensis]
MMGEQVARVIASKNPKFPEGTHVMAHFGWKSHTLVKDVSVLRKVPDIEDLPLSLTLGSLGMPGLTAYFGFLEKSQPKSGETVLVNTAAGAVGSIVGQIAKIKGCKVVAFAGTEEKCSWLKNELGFDQVFNYKNIDLDKVLSSSVPDGIDCYFDNVGGHFSSVVLNHMNTQGRVCICGCLSEYNVPAENTLKGPYPFKRILFKELSIFGFIVWKCMQRADEGRKQLLEWIKSGKLIYKETITEGFENMPKAFLGLFEGSNVGKAIVKA